LPELVEKILSMLNKKIEIPVRFNEADPLGIVWHGHYVRYFEDGREAFGKEYGIAYQDFYKHGLAVPIVSIHCDYRKPLRYGDTAVVNTVFEATAAAKLIFRYEVFDLEKDELAASGTSTQVFVDAKSFELLLTFPDFFDQWKNKWKV
jgi:acyl-CoA thioester hydrolase